MVLSNFGVGLLKKLPPWLMLWLPLPPAVITCGTSNPAWNVILRYLCFLCCKTSKIVYCGMRRCVAAAEYWKSTPTLPANASREEPFVLWTRFVSQQLESCCVVHFLSEVSNDGGMAIKQLDMCCFMHIYSRCFEEKNHWVLELCVFQSQQYLMMFLNSILWLPLKETSTLVHVVVGGGKNSFLYSSIRPQLSEPAVLCIKVDIWIIVSYPTTANQHWRSFMSLIIWNTDRPVYTESPIVPSKQSLSESLARLLILKAMNSGAVAWLYASFWTTLSPGVGF